MKAGSWNLRLFQTPEGRQYPNRTSSIPLQDVRQTQPPVRTPDQPNLTQATKKAVVVGRLRSPPRARPFLRPAAAGRRPSRPQPAWTALFFMIGRLVAAGRCARAQAGRFGPPPRALTRCLSAWAPASTPGVSVRPTAHHVAFDGVCKASAGSRRRWRSGNTLCGCFWMRWLPGVAGVALVWCCSPC